MEAMVSDRELLERAKQRCQDCPYLIEKDSLWWCDEADCAIEEVRNCLEWTQDRGRI